MEYNSVIIILYISDLSVLTLDLNLNTYNSTITTYYMSIVKQRLSVCLFAMNLKSTEQIFMRFSPIDRVIHEEGLAWGPSTEGLRGPSPPPHK